MLCFVSIFVANHFFLFVLLTLRPSCTAAALSDGPRRCPTHSPPQSAWATGAHSQRLQPQSSTSCVFVFPYLKLQYIAGLHDELAGCQDVVRVVLVLVRPVQVEGRVSTEAGGADGVGVEAPALLVGNALWLFWKHEEKDGVRRSQDPCHTTPKKQTNALTIVEVVEQGGRVDVRAPDQDVVDGPLRSLQAGAGQA